MLLHAKWAAGMCRIRGPDGAVDFRLARVGAVVDLAGSVEEVVADRGREPRTLRLASVVIGGCGRRINRQAARVDFRLTPAPAGVDLLGLRRRCESVAQEQTSMGP